MAKKSNNINIRFNFMWIWAFIITAIIAYSLFGEGRAVPVSADWNTVEEMISRGEVERIKVMNKNTAQVYLTDEAIAAYRAGDELSRFKNIPEQGEQLTFTIGSVDILDRDVKQAVADSGLEDNPVTLEYFNESTGWGDILLNVLPWVFLVGVWFFFIRSMSRGGAGGGHRPVAAGGCVVYRRAAGGAERRFRDGEHRRFGGADGGAGGAGHLRSAVRRPCRG